MERESDNMKSRGKSSAKTLKKLASCIGENKKTSVLCALLVIIEVIMEVLIPLVMAEIIDVGLAKGLAEYTYTFRLGNIRAELFTVDNGTTFIGICGAIMIVMALLSLFCGILAGRFAAEAATGFGANLRQRVFYKVENFSFANLDKFNTASLVTRLTTDITNIQFSYMMIVRTLVRAPIMLVLSLAVAISINAELSIVFAVALPIIIIALAFGVKLIFPRFMAMLEKYDDMNEATQENLVGIRAVKAYVREDYETKRFKDVSAKVQKMQFDAEKWLVIAMPFLQVIIFGSIIAIVWFGGNQIIAGDMQYGYLSSFLSYVMQVFMSLAMVAMVFVMVVLSRASAERIVEVFDEEIDVKDAEDATDEQVADGSIDFEDVDFSYSKNPEVLNLENINLHIKSGETIGIIGGTGSAKTTLVQLIPRLYDTFDGVVKVGGKDVKKYKIENLRSAVAMVLQKNVLFSGTIKENLLWGNPEATDEEIEHATSVAQAHDFISSFPDGYATDLGQGGVNVSGGQKQRLCIARALLKKPKVMIMDDSTSAVDTATDKAIREALKTEFSDITVLIIAQRITSVMDADRIIVMDNGKINDVGTHDELLERSEIYREVFESQQKGADENE